jgi:hypothetical protein
MKRMVKEAAKKVTQEAANIAKSGISDSMVEIAKDSIREELKKSGVADSVKENIVKKVKKLK